MNLNLTLGKNKILQLPIALVEYILNYNGLIFIVLRQN